MQREAIVARPREGRDPEPGYWRVRRAPGSDHTLILEPIPRGWDLTDYCASVPVREA